MTAREAEADMLARCAAVVRDPKAAARDRREANVFRVAAMVAQPRFPRESASLMQASERYFVQHPDDRLAAADVVRNGWIFSLPRFRDMLSLKLGISITQHVEREEEHEAFRQAGIEAWNEYQATGRHVTADEADAWLAKLEAGQDAEPPECHV